MLQPAFVHVYTGNGKGKTTAAIGLAVRAAGRGFKSAIVQFMKGQEYGEHLLLKRIPEIDIFPMGTPDCIHKEEINQTHIDAANRTFEFALSVMQDEKYQLVILDEICVTAWFGLLSEEQILQLVNSRPEHLELVLTGRYAPQALLEIADIVTEMKNVKHVYDEGIQARKGIEY
jgi:cob(I)alamin adenosyltransferase